MQKNRFYLLLISLALILSGCTNNGVNNGTSVSSTSLENSIELAKTDLAAVEGALMANRIEAVSSISSINAEVLSTGSGSDSLWAPPPPPPEGLGSDSQFEHRGRHFEDHAEGDRHQFRRGAEGCPFSMDGELASGARILIASHPFDVQKFNNTGYRIIKPDGSDIKVERPADGSSQTTITVDGVTWDVVFGETSDEPLATLTDTKSGRVLKIMEDDSGNLTLIPEGGHRCHGKWNQNGTLELKDEVNSQEYLYRSGI